jgi:hypothetical protein
LVDSNVTKVKTNRANALILGRYYMGFLFFKQVG